MRVSDYIVEYLIENKITDVFGYPGGMVTYLMDSLGKYQGKINAHVTYNEQGAALAACGYAQISGKVGVAYATSGPGATNMITGICNAYMDSVPTLFITGQVNSFEQKGNYRVRQRGFQETDIVSMVENCVKYSARVNNPKNIRYALEKALFLSTYKRKGPVLLDIAMDVFKSDIIPEDLEGYCPNFASENDGGVIDYRYDDILKNASCPVLVLGNGFVRDDAMIRRINDTGIPVVSSMIAVDLGGEFDSYYGFIGAYGNRVANIITEKSDLIISIGSRLDIRQVGGKRENFAPNAKIIRVDIDEGELSYKVHKDEIDICCDSLKALGDMLDVLEESEKSYDNWIAICNEIERSLRSMDETESNRIVRAISKYIKDNAVMTADVGQNQVWVAQSFHFKKGQRCLFSGGHGVMGYSLPAAIGAAIAMGRQVYSFNGDGGIQMNIQELQMVAREHLPIKIFIFNNHALGMIRHFQEMYFEGNYFQTTVNGGFSTPDFGKIADAYGLGYLQVDNEGSIEGLSECLGDDNPYIIEIILPEMTYVLPKLRYGMPNSDQEPLMDRKLYNRLMKLDESEIENV